MQKNDSTILGCAFIHFYMKTFLAVLLYKHIREHHILTTKMHKFCIDLRRVKTVCVPEKHSVLFMRTQNAVKMENVYFRLFLISE